MSYLLHPIHNIWISAHWRIHGRLSLNLGENKTLILLDVRLFKCRVHRIHQSFSKANGCFQRARGCQLSTKCRSFLTMSKSAKDITSQVWILFLKFGLFKWCMSPMLESNIRIVVEVDIYCSEILAECFRLTAAAWPTKGKKQIWISNSHHSKKRPI